MTTEPVLTDLDNDGVLTITINRPKRRNAFNGEAFIGLGQALREANENGNVAVVLLTGAGEDFSSGLDLADVGVNDEGQPPFEQMMDALCALDKPLIAAAKGCCVGFGTTVFFHCDIVYLGHGARLRMPFASLGLVTEAAASYLGPATIGHKQAAELIFTAAWFDAQKALAYGLATNVVPDDELHDHAVVKAREIARWPVDSLVEIKRTMKAPREEHIALARRLELEGFGKLMGGPANAEAFAAFLEKREPDFKQFRR